MTGKQRQFERGDLLLVIDVQKDFCPGGALAIEEGDAVVPVQYLKDNLSEDQFNHLMEARPKPKVTSLLELIEQAKSRNT